MGLLRLDKSEPQLLSLAKKAVAFLRLQAPVGRTTMHENDGVAGVETRTSLMRQPPRIGDRKEVDVFCGGFTPAPKTDPRRV